MNDRTGGIRLSETCEALKATAAEFCVIENEICVLKENIDYPFCIPHVTSARLSASTFDRREKRKKSGTENQFRRSFSTFRCAAGKQRHSRKLKDFHDGGEFAVKEFLLWSLGRKTGQKRFNYLMARRLQPVTRQCTTWKFELSCFCWMGIKRRKKVWFQLESSLDD